MKLYDIFPGFIMIWQGVHNVIENVKCYWMTGAIGEVYYYNDIIIIHSLVACYKWIDSLLGAACWQVETCIICIKGKKE